MGRRTVSDSHPGRKVRTRHSIATPTPVPLGMPVMPPEADSKPKGYRTVTANVPVWVVEASVQDENWQNVTVEEPDVTYADVEFKVPTLP